MKFAKKFYRIHLKLIRRFYAIYLFTKIANSTVKNLIYCRCPFWRIDFENCFFKLFNNDDEM